MIPVLLGVYITGALGVLFLLWQEGGLPLDRRNGWIYNLARVACVVLWPLAVALGIGREAASRKRARIRDAAELVERAAELKRRKEEAAEDEAAEERWAARKVELEAERAREPAEPDEPEPDPVDEGLHAIVGRLLDVLEMAPGLVAEARAAIVKLTEDLRPRAEAGREALAEARAQVELPAGVTFRDEDAANMLRDDAARLVTFVEVLSKLREQLGADVKVSADLSFEPEGCRVCAPPTLVVHVLLKPGERFRDRWSGAGGDPGDLLVMPEWPDDTARGTASGSPRSTTPNT